MQTFFVKVIESWIAAKKDNTGSEIQMHIGFSPLITTFEKCN